MSFRRFATLVPAVAFIVAGFVVLPSSVSPVQADDTAEEGIPANLDLTWQLASPVATPVGGSVQIEPTVIDVSEFGEIERYDGVGIPPQCIPADGWDDPSGWASCVGIATGQPGDRPPLTIYGGVPMEIAPAGSPDVREALDWIVDEAIDAIRAVYGVPLDWRIRVYAAADIRAYVHNRIVDILDRVAHNVALTPQEQLTFDLLERTVIETDRVAAHAAYDEYRAWITQGCGYEPPEAPRFVDEPVVMPSDVVSWCSRPQRGGPFDGVPPQPTVEHFQAWGAYRSAFELGLSRLDMAEAQETLTNTISAGIVLGGVATAIGASIVTSALVGSSLATATAVASAFGASATMSAAASVFGSAGVASIISAVGAAMAATVVATVVLAIVITAVGIFQLVEYAKVGETLLQRKEAAERSTDPFDLESVRALWAGLPLRSQLSAENPPTYRSQYNAARIAQLVTYWLATNPDGSVIGDGANLWDENATTGGDLRFELHDGERTETVDSIVLPGIDGPIEVRFSRSWMIVTPPGGTPTAALSFRYLQPNGEPAIASRSATPDGGWVIATASSDSTGFEGSRRNFLEYRGAEGQTVFVRIVDPLADLAGPHPTATGTLLPGRVVFLRPNPLTVSGSFDLDRFRDEFDYAWELERFDAATSSWVPVPVTDADRYGAKFVPEAVGTYRASVEMTSVDAPGASPLYGEVVFPIHEPMIVEDTLELLDSGGQELVVAAQFSEPVPTDWIDVTVHWPGQFGSDVRPSSTVRLDCHRDEFTCQTVETERFPELRSALTHELGPRSDLDQGVRVTVRNSYGSADVRHFAIDHPDRPRLAPPPTAPAATQLGTVHVADGAIAAHLVAEVDENPNYALATVIPGDTDLPDPSFGFWDPDANRIENSMFLLDNERLQVGVHRDASSGEWVLGLWGEPTFADLGVWEVPLVLQQDNGARRPFMLTVEIVGSPDDRFRAVLLNSIDPDDYSVDGPPEMFPLVMGGRSDWGGFDGEVCVGLRNLNTMPDPAVTCGPELEFLAEDGGPVAIPYRALLPDGVPAGVYEARSWIASSGAAEDQEYAGAHVVTFAVRSGAPAIVELSWDAQRNSAVLEVEPFSASAAITSVRCELDEVPTECWAPDGGEWTPAALTDGQHELRVWIDDAVGNYTSGSLSFTTAPVTTDPTDPTDPGPTDPTPTDPGPTDPPGGTPPSPGGAPGSGTDATPPVAGAPADPGDERDPSDPDLPGTVDSGSDGRDEDPGSADGTDADPAGAPATRGDDGLTPVLLWLLAAVLIAAAIAGIAVVVRRRGS